MNDLSDSKFINKPLTTPVITQITAEHVETLRSSPGQNEHYSKNRFF
jgi:hypothetical protein